MSTDSRGKYLNVKPLTASWCLSAAEHMGSDWYFRAFYMNTAACKRLEYSESSEGEAEQMNNKLKLSVKSMNP